MRYIKLLPTAMLAILVLSCGGQGPLQGPEDALARVGDHFITEEDFREMFSGLSPEQQVAVLDPGGRLNLVDRMINKELLELAADSLELPEMDWWKSLYAQADLADRYAARMVESARSLAADTTRWPQENWFVMDIVLIRDSSTAAEVARAWESEGPAAPDSTVMALAPWSWEGSSFRTLENYVGLMPTYLSERVMDHINEGVAVAPLFDAWAVFRITVRESETPMRVEDAIPAAMANMVYSEAGLLPRSPSIEGFIAGLVPEEGSYVPTEGSWEPGDTLVSYRGGALTAGEAAEMFGKLRRNNFLSEPSELVRLMPPVPGRRNMEVDLWVYFTGLARLRWQAERALEEGMEVDSNLLRMAEVEHLLRTMIIDSLRSVDSSTLESFYTENIQQYTIPERRVVLRADIPASDTAGISGLASLREVEAEEDSPIRMSLSPPLAQGAFGSLGEDVFEADTSGVYGPIVRADTLPLTYFQVMAVLPDSVIGFSDIAGCVRDDYVSQNADSRLSEFLMELRDTYDVEIDSTAVRRVDPW